jgi:putative ABC transport system permease protein
MRLREILLRLRAKFRHSEFESGVEDEIAFHLSMSEERFRAQGMDHRAARAAAQRRFGNQALMGETLREMRGWGALERFWLDVRFTARQMRLNPGFAAGAILPLALAIGCTTAVLSLVDAVLFRPTGVENPGRVAAVYTFSRSNSRYLSDSYPDFRDVEAMNGLVESAAAYIRLPLSVRLAEGAEPMNGEMVSGDYFRATGVLPALGRPLLPADDLPGAAPVAMASYGVWESRYRRSRSVLGSLVKIDGVVFTIVGVMPEGYRGMLLDWNGDSSFWLPLEHFNRFFPANTAPDYKNRREVQMLMMMARLRDGVPIRQFQAALDVLSVHVAVRPDYRFLALPALQARFFPAYRAATVRFLWMLIAVSAAALAIACFNLANLLSTRSAAREREIATRLAVGADGLRLLRQFLVENAAIAACACFLSLPVTMGVIYWLHGARITRGFDLALNLSPDGLALSAGMVIGFATGILSGMVPALKATSGRWSRQGRRARLRDLFILAQIVCAMVVLSPAVEIRQSLRELNQARLGYDTHGILLASLGNVSGSENRSHENADRLYRVLLEDLRSAAPGAALARDTIPNTFRMTLDIATDSAQGSGRWTPMLFNWVSDGYFELLRMPVLNGRTILPGDDRHSQPVAIVNRAAAEMLWPGQNPVGRRLRIRPEKADREVAGVVEDARYRPLGESRESLPFVFLPLLQMSSFTDLNLYVRTPGAPLDFVRTLRHIAGRVAPDATVSGVQTFEASVQSGLAQIRMAAQATGAVSALGLILAGAGIFAAAAYRVAQRKKEIALRLAVGAEPGRLIQSFAVRGFFAGVAGACIGLLPAIWSVRLLQSSIQGVGSPGPALYAIACGALALAAAAASCGAASRIAKIRPADLLRTQ